MYVQVDLRKSIVLHKLLIYVTVLQSLIRATTQNAKSPIGIIALREYLPYSGHFARVPQNLVCEAIGNDYTRPQQRHGNDQWCFGRFVRKRQGSHCNILASCYERKAMGKGKHTQRHTQNTQRTQRTQKHATHSRVIC